MLLQIALGHAVVHGCEIRDVAAALPCPEKCLLPHVHGLARIQREVDEPLHARVVLLLRHREDDLVLQILAFQPRIETAQIIEALCTLSLAEPEDCLSAKVLGLPVVFGIRAKDRKALAAPMLRETEDRLVTNVLAPGGIENVLEKTDCAVFRLLREPEHGLLTNFLVSRLVSREIVEGLNDIDAVSDCRGENCFARCLPRS